MAASTFAMDIPNTLESNSANAPSDVNDNFTEVAGQFNGSMETADGHSHNGTDSRLIVMGDSEFTSNDFMMMMIGGGIS